MAAPHFFSAGTMKLQDIGRRLFASALLLQGGGAFAVNQSSTSQGDPKSGEQVYARCMACHSLTENRIGPEHCGVFGRRAGSVPDFDYSPVMRAANIAWGEKTLNQFLADPMKYLPGTAMVFAGVPDQKERADVIAWLKEARPGSAACPTRSKR